MRICLFSPYIPDVKGGGERYLFDVALALIELGHQVEIAVSRLDGLSGQEAAQIRSKYEAFLGRDLSEIEFVATPLHTSASSMLRYMWTRQYDVLYYITDGSWFFSGAKRNIMHVQTPLSSIKVGWLDKLRARSWQVINTNSDFTRQVVEQYWGLRVNQVHHPMIDLKPALNLYKKEHIILSVGRFFSQLHSKRQDVLVEMFKKLISEKPNKAAGWRLILIGAKEEADYAHRVASQAKGLPIKILHDVSRQELINWYQRATIYWHASGFDIDERVEPEKVEHFGISTAEAMSQGVVPVVINKGGQPEVVGPELAHLMWQSQAEGLDRTWHVMNLTQAGRKKLAEAAIDQIKQFSPQVFKRQLKNMVAGEKNSRRQYG